MAVRNALPRTFELRQSDCEILPAILAAAGARSLADAVVLLGGTKGNVRGALAELGVVE